MEVGLLMPLGMAATNKLRKKASVESGLSLGRLGDFVGFRLRRIQNYLSRDFSVATSEHNLKQGQFSGLAIIAANPGLSQIELAREIGLDKSLTVQMVDELERRGWAERRRSVVDRRRHDLFVTPDGEAVLVDLFGQLDAVERNSLEVLSDEEHVILNELLDRIYKACFRASHSKQ
jgi:DNA-binding MarR family transcriptional regulator